MTPNRQEDGGGADLQAPKGLSRCDAQWWLDHRAKIIVALQAEGMEIWSDKDRVWLHRIAGSREDGGGAAGVTEDATDRPATAEEQAVYQGMADRYQRDRTNAAPAPERVPCARCASDIYCEMNGCQRPAAAGVAIPQTGQEKRDA